jgi:porin
MTRPAWRTTAAVCLAIGCSVSVRAQDWKEDLARRGVTVTVVYGGTIFSALAGGIRRGETYSGNLDVELALDGEPLLGRRGLTLFVDGLWIHGGQPSTLVGDAQGVSNLSAAPRVTLHEAWVQYNLFGSRLSVLVGRYDLASEFYRLRAAGLFLNGSFGIGPEFSGSGVAGPSIFPDTSVGARLAVKPLPNVVIRGAVFDGVPIDRPDHSVRAFKSGDGLLLVSETVVLNRTAQGEPTGKVRFRIGRASGLPPYDDKVAFGGWYYTARFDDLDAVGPNGSPVQHSGSGGVYGLADATLFRSHTDPTRRVAGFVQAGLGDGRVDRFGSYLGAGLVGAGLLSRRSMDEVGLAVARAPNGSGYIDQQMRIGTATTASETVIEVTYLAQLAKWLAVQPDFQYVIHPNTAVGVRNVRAFQLRFEATF